jgi:hypothetical protein
VIVQSFLQLQKNSLGGLFSALTAVGLVLIAAVSIFEAVRNRISTIGLSSRPVVYAAQADDVFRVDLTLFGLGADTTEAAALCGAGRVSYEGIGRVLGGVETSAGLAANGSSQSCRLSFVCRQCDGFDSLSTVRFDLPLFDTRATHAVYSVSVPHPEPAGSYALTDILLPTERNVLAGAESTTVALSLLTALEHDAATPATAEHAGGRIGMIVQPIDSAVASPSLTATVTTPPAAGGLHVAFQFEINPMVYDIAVLPARTALGVIGQISALFGALVSGFAGVMGVLETKKKAWAKPLVAPLAEEEDNATTATAAAAK